MMSAISSAAISLRSIISHLHDSISDVRWRQLYIVLGTVLASQLLLIIVQFWENAVDDLRVPAVRKFSERDDANVAICMAVKGQQRDLTEYLRHHYYNIGIKHFYIMDDGSVPPLEHYNKHNYYGVPQDVLTFHYFKQYEKERAGDMQHHIYNYCNTVYGFDHDWIGYLDVDEYVGVFTNRTLSDILRPLRNDDSIGALGVNWRIATSNGHNSRVSDIRKAYTTCIYDDPVGQGHNSDNRHIKSFVKPRFYAWPETVHRFRLRNGAMTVGELGDEVTSSWRYPPTREYVGIYHYAVKSKQEYQEKIDRGNAEGIPKQWDWWDYIHKLPSVPCWEMAHYDI